MQLPQLSQLTTKYLTRSNIQHLFPTKLLSYNFWCMTGVDFAYHHQLYNTFDNYISLTTSLHSSVVSSFQLKIAFIFLPLWFINAISFWFFYSVNCYIVSSWCLSQYTFASNNFGDNVSCCRSCLYLSPNQLPISSLLSPTLPYDFLSTTSWISPTFKTLSFSLITTKNPYYLLVSCSNCPTFHEQKSIL